MGRGEGIAAMACAMLVTTGDLAYEEYGYEEGTQ